MYNTYIRFEKKILIVGFGSIGQGVLPLLFRHIEGLKPENVHIITKDETGESIAREFGVSFQALAVTKENYLKLINHYLSQGDFLLNLSVEVSSRDLIVACQEKGILYLDTCIEPWAGGYTDLSLSSAERSNYRLREEVLALRESGPKATAVITHGANPGLVSHLVKQALLNIAHENNLDIAIPTHQAEWAKLAALLEIKVIHVAERDTQVALTPKQPGEFVNTWSIDGFVAEGSQPAELGWGSHEKHFPSDGGTHGEGCQAAIYLNRPGASTRIRTWTPSVGSFHGFLITHGEAISIADYFTLSDKADIIYRPTVHYAYHPCEDAVMSLHELAGKEWRQQEEKRLLLAEIVDGYDELGVLLMGNKRGAYWYGSHLSIHEARKLAPYNNATSLQVAVSVLGGLVWAIMHPNEGIVEPEAMDFKAVLEFTQPYLGKLEGHFTDWTPLQGRGRLFPERVDETDPWQFLNIRVT